MEDKVILLVEDETDVMLANQEYLEKRGLTVVMAETLQEARVALESRKIDLILLDVNMPDGSGFQFIGEIRARHTLPVIFLTCQTQSSDEIRGLERGGNDYITKPYKLDVLYARISAQLRAYGQIAVESSVELGGIQLDVHAQKAHINGQDALLKPKEFALLLFFIQNKGVVFSEEAIYQAVWGQPSNGDTRTVKVHIHALRKKLCLAPEDGVPCIETLPQQGYRLTVRGS